MNTRHWTQGRWSRVARAAGLGLMITAGAAWAANDLDTPNPRGTTHPDGSNTYNTEWLGHNDLQGRTVYQTTVHTQGHRVIAYAGHFAGTMLNPMTGVVENNGTSIVDVTDPRHPVYLKHLIANKGGARMVEAVRWQRLAARSARPHLPAARERRGVPRGVGHHRSCQSDAGLDAGERASTSRIATGGTARRASPISSAARRRRPTPATTAGTLPAARIST